MWISTPFIDDRLDERVVGDRLAHHRDRHRTTTDHVTELVAVGVTAPVGVVGEDEHDVGPVGLALAATLGHRHERVGRVRLARLATARLVAPRDAPGRSRHRDGSRTAPRPRAADRNWPATIPSPSTQCRTDRAAHCRRCNSSRSIDPNTTRRASSRRPAMPVDAATSNNARLRAGHRRLGPHDLPRLRQRHVARRHRLARRRTLRQRCGRRQRLTRLRTAWPPSCAPPTPHHRAPHATARAAARAAAAVHAFAARANSSARRAQSSPDQRSASNRAAAARTSTNNSDKRATTLLPNTEKLEGRS